MSMSLRLAVVENDLALGGRQRGFTCAHVQWNPVLAEPGDETFCVAGPVQAAECDFARGMPYRRRPRKGRSLSPLEKNGRVG